MTQEIITIKIFIILFETFLKNDLTLNEFTNIFFDLWRSRCREPNYLKFSSPQSILVNKLFSDVDAARFEGNEPPPEKYFINEEQLKEIIAKDLKELKAIYINLRNNVEK